MEELRTFLYPLGFIATLAYAGRFILQWIMSERQHKSVVSRPFWILSLMGNLFMILHTLIQIQMSVCLIQACNAVISWRNINLMKEKEKHVQFSTVILFMLGVIFLTICLFALQGILLGEMIWMRTPKFFWSVEEARDISLEWHIFGLIGILLFASRFWVQWLCAERQRESFLGEAFWWLSLAGALISVTYFIQMRDIVNAIGPGFGMIPYIRNLMLIRKTPQPSVIHV